MRPLLLMERLILGCVVFLLSCGFPGPVGAQEPVDALKEQLWEMQDSMSEMHQKMNKLMKRIGELEREKAGADRVTSVEQSVKSIQESPPILNPSIGLAIDSTFERRPDSHAEFRLRTVELGLSAEIDPYARAYTFITGTDEGVEIEEAAVQTTSLPVNLSAGRFFSDFGRLAQFHVHELPFVNAPLSLNRIVGGESLGTGVQFRYLLPTPFFLSLTGGAFDEIGHAHGDEEHGHEEGGVEEEGEDHEEEHEEGEEHGEEGGGRFLSQLTYLGRVHAFFDLSQTWNLEMGSSLALTPRTETGEEGSRRSRFGIDVTLRHRPLVAGLYEGFTVAGEWLSNRQSHHDAPSTHARGGYAYAQLDFNPEIQGRWGLGLLFDSAPDLEHPSDKTLSLSPYVTWSLSEFNRLRLQYTYGWDRTASPAHDGSQVYLQWTTVLGSHTHGFRERR